jgi:hypothetical protein
MPQVAISVGMTRLNSCVSMPSSAHPAKQPHSVRFSGVDISRYQFMYLSPVPVRPALVVGDSGAVQQ